MLQFRVYLSDYTMQIVEASSGEQARKLAAELAKGQGLLVRKVKLQRN